MTSSNSNSKNSNTEIAVDVLRPLNDKEFSELLELYKEKYDTNKFQYLLLHTHYQWNKQLIKLNVDNGNNEWISFRKTFYTHCNGDFRKYGTYVCIHHDLIQSVAFHTWEPSCNELLDCLSKTDLIQWRKGPLLVSVAKEYSEKVKEIAILKGVTIKSRQCQGFILQTDKAMKLEMPRLPEGYSETLLQEPHAELVYSLWANKKEASLNYIRGFIRLQRCIGIKEKATNSLVGWIFQNEFSGLGILQVIESAQGMGLGKYLAIAMSKLLNQTSKVNSSAFVVLENIKSKSLLEKIGYGRIVIHEWIQLAKLD